MAFSRKNSVCSNSSINSAINININRTKENKNRINFNLNFSKKEKIEIKNTKSNKNIINIIKQEESEEIIIPQNTFNARKNSCKEIISEVRALYQSNFNNFQELISSNNNTEFARKISLEPERILDAPNLSDNPFYNPIDWGSKNILSVCLGPYDYL